MEQFFFHLQSILILSLFLFGITKRRNHLLHSRIMKAGIFWDIILILQIEFSRSAIQKASETVIEGQHGIEMKIHLFFALSTVLLYIPMVYWGQKLLKGDKSWKKFHRICGITTLIFRFLTLATAFLVA